ncbi:MAG: SIMPL domain-containing protein [Clostridia bacterium]|nr:SIMPL domain-containing protein [Clostridia bacterium]
MKKIASLLLAILIISLTPTFASADSEIRVTGTGEVLIPADTAVVSLGVSAADKDVRTAQGMANEAIAAIRSALIEGGIAEEDINTDYINIYAMYDYGSGSEQITGYNANSTLAIRVKDIDRVGEVIDLAFGAGANTLNGINFSATDTTVAKEKAMRLAVADAQAKADVLADAAGLQIRGIEDIAEQNTYSYDKGVVNNFDVVEASAAGTVVQAAKLTVSSSIVIAFKADR